MQEKQIFARILGIESPWRVSDVAFSFSESKVTVRLEHAGSRPSCPECGKACPGYDSRRRSWRHLDTCHLMTILEAEVPRVKCPEHGVRLARVPWAEERSRYTASFEALAIAWAQEASVSAVSKRLRLSWNAVDGIKGRAVKRGLARRGPLAPKRICVDETSFRRGHDYVTVVTDPDRGTVLHVAEGRTVASLASFYETLSQACRDGIECVSMDMWKAYIRATRDALKDAGRRIAFDRFHVARSMGKGVDQVRRRESRRLAGRGDGRLKGSRFQWLRSAAGMSEAQRAGFEELRRSAEETSRAWTFKELASRLWACRDRVWAERAWNRLIEAMAGSSLPPMERCAEMLRRHLYGIVNAAVLGADNSHAESMNSRIRTLKSRARGFRNRRRFLEAIYFHLGGLDLYPATGPKLHRPL